MSGHRFVPARSAITLVLPPFQQTPKRLWLELLNETLFLGIDEASGAVAAQLAAMENSYRARDVLRRLPICAVGATVCFGVQF